MNQQSKTVVQRLRETTVSVNPCQPKKQTTNRKKNTNNEPSISDILVMLTQMKSDINNNIGQLSNRLAKLEAKPTAKNIKKNV